MVWWQTVHELIFDIELSEMVNMYYDRDTSI